MAKVKRKHPLFDFKDISYNVGKLVIKLDCEKPVKIETDKYGKKYVWIGIVENTTVYSESEKKKIKNYSGKVMFFPSEPLNNKLIKICNGELGIIVNIKKTVKKKGRWGLIREYPVEKVSDKLE